MSKKTCKRFGLLHFFKEGLGYAHEALIIQYIVKTIVLWNIITSNNRFVM